MTIKNVMVPVEVEYLQAAAAERGVSRSKLVRVVMKKVVEKKLVPQIIDDDDLIEPPVQRYRRFRDRA
jgi:hypothetical protein